jgi:hypothetical protein
MNTNMNLRLKTKTALVLLGCLFAGCTAKEGPGVGAKTCDVVIDRSTPGRIAHTAYLMASRCSISEDEAVELLDAE